MGIDVGPIEITDGLVFQFDAGNSRSYSGSGLTAYGLVGGIEASLVNGTGYSSANNGSFFFDGTNDYINFSSYTPDANTINIWVNFKSLQNGPLVYVGNDAYNSGLWSWSFFNFSSAFYFRANPGSFAYFSEVPTLNTWINYTLIRNNGSNISLAYKNGSAFGSTTDSTTTNSYSNMRFGAGGGNFANFNLSQVQIYNRALTAQEILQNYNATKGRYGL